MCAKKLGKFRDKHWLSQKYLVELRTAGQIAKAAGVSKRTVLIQLHEFSIPLRKACACPPGKFRDKRWLIKQYEVLHKSSNKIAKELNVTHHTIVRQLRKFGITPRPNSRVAYIGHPLRNREEFERLYVGKKMLLSEIAEKFGLDRHTVIRWRKELGITINPPKRGEESPRYKGIVNVNVHIRGWIAAYWTPLVFQRDDYACCLCGSKKRVQAHHLVHVAEIVTRVIQANRKLDLKTVDGREKLINKIIHDKQFRDVENGITLCPGCHGIFHGKEYIPNRSTS